MKREKKNPKEIIANYLLYICTHDCIRKTTKQGKISGKTLIETKIHTNYKRYKYYCSR